MREFEVCEVGECSRIHQMFLAAYKPSRRGGMLLFQALAPEGTFPSNTQSLSKPSFWRLLPSSVGPQLAFNTSADHSAPALASLIVASSTPVPATIPSWRGAGFARWIDLNEMDFSLRYRSTFDSNNAHQYDQGQQRSIIDGKFKFDQAGRYGIAFHASTGRYFNWF